LQINLKNGIGNGEINGQMMQINLINGIGNGEINGQITMAALFTGSGENMRFSVRESWFSLRCCGEATGALFVAK
jgi:hypothetical protein